MGKVVAIGGGELKETFFIDKFIVEFSNIRNPKVLFIPTASDDSYEYIEAIEETYVNKLGCRVDILLLTHRDITEAEIGEKILSSDIIYVGGGDTVRMMEIWNEKNVNKYLNMAYERGIVLSGISAGAICWFLKGHGDRSSQRNKEGWWDYKQVKGLGIILAIVCPHYNHEGHEGFDRIMAEEDVKGIAIEDNCALVIEDSKYRVIKSDDQNNVYLLENKDGTVEKEIMDFNEYKELRVACDIY